MSGVDLAAGAAALAATAPAKPEVPQLRETFTMEGAAERWAQPCPDWCLGSEYEGHDAARIEAHGRQHGGQVFRVRQDGGYGYADEIEAVAGHTVPGTRSSHLEVRLVAGSRSSGPRVSIVARSGGPKNGPASFEICALFLDEVDELIAVLQYLRSVGGVQ